MPRRARDSDLFCPHRYQGETSLARVVVLDQLSSSLGRKLLAPPLDEMCHPSHSECQSGNFP